MLKHVESIQKCSRPEDSKQLQCFLGLVNLYRRFIPSAAGILRLLSNALKGGCRSKLQWTDQMQAAFEAGKTAVCRVTQLGNPDPETAVNLVVDASDTHSGAVLQQETATWWTPLSFFSKKLSTTESRYSPFDRELWAVFLGIRHFRHLLEGRQFHVLTDHKPLTTAYIGYQSHGRLNSSSNWHTLPSSPPIFGTLQGRTMSWPTPCPSQEVPPSLPPPPLGVLEADGAATPLQPGIGPPWAEMHAWQHLINRPSQTVTGHHCGGHLRRC